MASSNFTYQHPYGSLEAFALDALDPEEEQAVAGHLEWCISCANLVEQNLRVSLAMADSLPRQELPDALRTLKLDVTDPPASSDSWVSVSTPRPARSWARVSWGAYGRWARRLSPVVALLAVAAVAVTAVLNLQFAGQMDNMQSENVQLQRQLDQSMATTQVLASSSDTVSRMQGNLQQWQQTSYALAQPGNHTLVLSPAGPGIDSGGVLVMSEDGRESILMASDLAPPQLDEVYDVWLTQGSQWFWAGEMNVDERGWGTMALSAPESLFDYDSVQLCRGKGAAAARAATAGSTSPAQATASVIGDVVLTVSLR